MRRLNSKHSDRLLAGLQVIPFRFDGRWRALTEIVADLAELTFVVVMNSKWIVLVGFGPVMHVFGCGRHVERKLVVLVRTQEQSTDRSRESRLFLRIRYVTRQGGLFKEIASVLLHFLVGEHLEPTGAVWVVGFEELTAKSER